MLAVTRHRVAEEDSTAWLQRARELLAALSTRPGFRGGRIGRALDDPALWLLVSEWDGVGAYRRALSALPVRVVAEPLLAGAVREPSTYEICWHADPGESIA